MEKLSREENSHKGENGRVTALTGSKDFTGAPVLVGKAALRTGADLVKILTSEDIRDVIAGHSPNLIVEQHEGDYFSESSLDAFEELAEWSDAMVMGPGLSNPSKSALRGAVENSIDKDTALIMDADAIRPVVGMDDPDLSHTIFTPHEREADFILEHHGSLKEFSEQTGAVVVLKGKVDEIISGGDRWENETGTPAMTVGGTGDVLTGIIAALIGQGLEREEAACLGTWLAGRSGEEAAKEHGNGMLATDMIESIPGVMMKR